MTDKLLPESLAVTPNIPLEKQTIEQLEAERDYWIEAVKNASGFASAKAADDFRKGCEAWIARRRKEQAVRLSAWKHVGDDAYSQETMTEKLNRPTIHPLAFPDNRSGFNGIKAGDKIIVEALPDGDALVTFDDGEHAIVKWRRVTKQ